MASRTTTMVLSGLQIWRWRRRRLVCFYAWCDYGQAFTIKAIGGRWNAPRPGGVKKKSHVCITMQVKIEKSASARHKGDNVFEA